MFRTQNIYYSKGVDNMNNKGITFLDGVVGIIIISMLIFVVSNYRGFVMEADAKIDAAIELQMQTHNLMEHIYASADWNALDLSAWQDFGAVYTYLGVFPEHNIERIALTLTLGDIEREYLLERSSLAPH